MDLLGLIGTGVTLLITGANVAFFIVVKFNDLVHLQKSQEEIKITLREIDKKLDNTSERIAKIEGKCAVNHKI